MKVLPLVLLLATARADDLAPLSDEFGEPGTIGNWQDLVEVEGWQTPAHEAADIAITTPGRFHIVPAANTWFSNLRGLLFFKEIEGDFIATMRVRVLSRHNPADPTEVPNRSFSLTGIFAHAPRAITQAAPDPFTTGAVWPPGDFGSDYVPDTENYLFLSYGTAGNPGTRQFEIKATRNSDSRLYYDDNGIPQNETEAWLQMVRVGDTFVCLRKHGVAGDWIVENRYPNPNHPLPAFGSTLQVGITAYTDWPTAQPFWLGGIEDMYHFNYAPPATGQPDLVAEVDYLRFRRPAPGLTEAALQGMAVSFLGGGGQTNVTADPPVLLSASPAAAPYLGDGPDVAFDPAADGDGDGYPDAIEVVLGTDPADPAESPLLASAVVGGAFQFQFPHHPGSGLTLVVQWSTDLDVWSPLYVRSGDAGNWSADPVGHSLVVDGGTVTISVPLDSECGFLRLGVY